MVRTHRVIRFKYYWQVIKWAQIIFKLCYSLFVVDPCGCFVAHICGYLLFESSATICTFVCAECISVSLYFSNVTEKNYAQLPYAFFGFLKCIYYDGLFVKLCVCLWVSVCMKYVILACPLNVSTHFLCALTSFKQFF
jgi:hypothetical protein